MDAPAKTKISLRVTQASPNQTALDWPQNMANLYAAIDEAVRQGSDIVLTPELSLTGYEVNDDFQRTDNNRIYAALSNIAAYANAKDPNLLVSVGNPWRLQLREAFQRAGSDPDIVKNPLYDRLNLPFNVQTLIGGGEILGMTAKANLFRDERGYENRYFNEWSFRDAKQVADLTGLQHSFGTLELPMPDGKVVPFGRPIICVTDKDGLGYVHAVAICEEKWVASQYDGPPHNDKRYDQLNIIPYISNHLGGAEGLFLELSNASPPSKLKQDKHMHLNDLASDYFEVVVDTDGLGTSGATFAQFGHRLISQNGETISAGPRMEFDQVGFTTSTIQITNAQAFKKHLAHGDFVRKFKAPEAKVQTSLAWSQEGSKAEWDDPANPDRWKEERIRNQALWMFDYMRKAKSIGITEALSGGKDSSFNCAMVRVMVELALNDLGIDGFCEQMAHLPYLDKIRDAYDKGGQEAAAEACMEDMLTAVYMGTNNSSFETWYAAKTLIDGDKFEDSTPFKGIGGKFLERNVQDLVTSCAFIFGTENSTKIPHDRKAEILEALADFVHASPYVYTPQQMKDWGDDLQSKYPELESLTSAALPGQNVAYENFQARIRQVLIMAITNIEKKLPIANPNLDEAYGAYATFGGDLHSGTLNWNAGLHKADQEALMDYLEDKGVKNVMERIVSLAPANNNKPTAELQPKQYGKVVQNDEDAMEGTFPQKAALARLRHHTKLVTSDGARWMNAGELFEKAREDAHFDALDDNKLFNAVAVFYRRWEGPAQNKVHATPIANTFGENVDKQTSLRTPNLSGQSLDEIAALAIDILFNWAEEEQLGWSDDEYKLLQQRTWQDLGFVEEFYDSLFNTDQKNVPNTTFDLKGVFEKLKTGGGWNQVYSPIQSSHPLATILNLQTP